MAAGPRQQCAHRFDGARQLVHEKIMVATQLRDVSARRAEQRSQLLRPVSFGNRRGEYGRKHVQVLGADVYRQSRPEEIEARERCHSIGPGERVVERAEQFVQLRVIHGEQSFKTPCIFRRMRVVHGPGLLPHHRER
jgi:hypothetical protein